MKKRKGDDYNVRARDQNFSRSNGFSAERKGIGKKFGKCRGINRENAVNKYNLVIIYETYFGLVLHLKK